MLNIRWWKVFEEVLHRKALHKYLYRLSHTHIIYSLHAFLIYSLFSFVFVFMLFIPYVPVHSMAPVFHWRVCQVCQFPCLSSFGRIQLCCDCTICVKNNHYFRFLFSVLSAKTCGPVCLPWQDQRRSSSPARSGAQRSSTQRSPTQPYTVCQREGGAES